MLDLTRVLAGPVATRFLAGFGADVLRIDPPDWNEAALEPERDIVEPPREVPSRRLDALEDREDLDLGAQVDALRALRIELREALRHRVE